MSRRNHRGFKIIDGKISELRHCVYCRSTENLTIDHKIPKVKGGSDALSNLQCLCKKCNTFKSDLTHNQLKTIWRWLNEINQKRRNAGKGEYGRLKPFTQPKNQ